MGKVKISFDIGSSSMKMAVSRRGGFQVEEVRLPENLVDGGGITMPNIFTEFLKSTRKELGLPHGPAALVLPPSQAICRLVTLPRMDQDQLALNLPYEFADFIEGDPEQYFCDYAMCEPLPEDGGMVMMAAVASKRRLAEYHRIFSRAGFRLCRVLPQEMALIQAAAEHRGRTDGPAEYCFIDLGQQSTRVTVVSGDRVQAVREIGVGCLDLDRAIAGEMGVDAFLAGSYKADNFQGVLDAPAVLDVCDQIAVELLKVVNFYQFTYRESALTGVYLIGGGAAIAPLRRAVEEGVGLELLPAEELAGGGSPGVFAAGAALGGA